MKIEEALAHLDIIRMAYICDPLDCRVEKGGELCEFAACDKKHEALAMAIEALELVSNTGHRCLFCENNKEGVCPTKDLIACSDFKERDTE